MLIGYARVSTEDQHLELQMDALNSAGCKRMFTDKISGTRTTRPGLADALSHARKGDTLVVWKLDRLGRSVKGLVELVSDLEAASNPLQEFDRRHRHRLRRDVSFSMLWRALRRWSAS